MSQELLNQIERAKAQMSNFDEDTPHYKHYQSLVIELEAKLPKKQVTLTHVPEATCEACQ